MTIANRFLKRSVVAGAVASLAALTLALALAWGWTNNAGSGTALESSKLVWVVLSWIVFILAILARMGQGRKAERGALASVVGFVVVVVLYVVLRASAAQVGTFL